MLPRSTRRSAAFLVGVAAAAGLIMWIPFGSLYTAIGLALFAAWLREMEVSAPPLGAAFRVGAARAGGPVAGASGARATVAAAPRNGLPSTPNGPPARGARPDGPG